uniref:Mitochondrial import inner membrane translocase subunit TIM23 n=2 Tax=Sinocyclocheilus anshuiensis TaxID=1608454 RepID=A0A671Q058_9TELE
MKSSAITRVILRQCYVSGVLSLYGKAACGGQKYGIARSESENRVIIKHQHLTTQRSNICVGFSTDDMDNNTPASGGFKGGLGSLFGGGTPEYSNTELAGVPLTGMSPLSPYLNVDPRYLVQDTEEFILPTGANKTRGRFELAFFTIGGCCITGTAFGTLNGLRMGLTETRGMPWSKPRNVQILNMVTRHGASWANTLGSVALLYSVFGVAIEKARGAEDDLNTVAAGTLTGMLFKSTAGLKGAARGGLIGLAMSGLYALYNNWDHLKGTSPSHY